ncbi:uncharacterized protein LOC123313693 isoform X2 [Coccinella septempunctata]|uniref:uncharacterized protein LOC123313693 isoform X2 n=1 Tax=Coccinella septempunctata TaxID=41139 RepID=UPI001D08684C|nr:uncharacterized protein LOC123313693 isoform X2 [Coccinella septempunctata]
MANDECMNDYRNFFQYFHETLDPNDQLPVRISSYRLFKEEVVGAIFNWTNQYLNDKKCPRHLISFLSRIVIEETRKRCKKQPVQCGFNPSENAYGPLKLMHTVIEVINEVCLNYKSSLNVQNRQNMAVSYPLPAPEDVYSVVSTSALKNMRRKMEDRLIVVHDLNTIFTKQDTTPSHYYAVFDGHGGEHAAAYSANHLHQYLAESTNFTSNPEQAIRDAFSKTDCMFIKKCETEKIDSGTTAVCALLLPKEKTLYVAWVGDSQAALVSGGKVRSCVEPHRPDRQDERQRIVDEGGTILHWGVWRVNGKLSVSRAIGDADYKPYVSATPDIVKIPLGGEEDFLILASDGLWDHLTKIKTAKVVYEALYFSPERAKTISRDLVDLAKRNGSSDNISVIVVFLRDPHQIASGLRWDNRLVIMDTLDNANNPFAIPNKTNNDDLLLNFADELKKDDIPNNDLIKMLEKSNCGRLTPDFDKDNLGPETNVDVPDDGPTSPNFDQMKRPTEALDNNQNCSNPFNDIEKSLELNLNLKAGTFEGLTSPTVEECVPPANSVHNVSQLIDAGAESDSEEDEEEWNYVRGEEANKENANPLPLSSQVAEEEDEDIENAMSQLNPNAAEFIPSPARAVASPLGRLLDEDQVLSRSPKKPPPTEVDINVPNQRDFEKDISLKPHEIEEAFSNGHQDAFNNETNAINALNSRLDEFHFGPNAAPFTPAKLLDQSETSSTRANYGDESELGVSFNDSMLSQDQNDFVQKDDPMSMSFHQDRSDDSNLFDLNKVHVLPENVDEFIAKEDKANSLFDDTISDLTEHFPLGNPEEKSKLAETEFTTDLDHEDKNMEQLDFNQSSTPIEDRSQSPSDTQTSVDDDRVLSPREEIRTPVEEASQASPVEECKIPKIEEHLDIQDREETRSKSPNEQNRLYSPFEDEHLISSPVEEHKSPSPYEEKEMYSTQEEKDVCSPVEENDVCCLISKQNEPRNDEKEVFEEKDLLSEKDLIQEEKYMEEKQLEDVESVAEKEVIEEKDVLEPQRENFSPVEAIASPDSTRDIISPVQERQLYSPEEEVEDSLVQEKEISPSDSEMDTAPIAEEIASSVQERIVTPEVERQVASPLQDGEITSQATFERDMTSPTQEEEIVSSAQDLTSIQEKDIVLSPQEECVLVRETVESPSLEQEVSTAEIDEDNFATVEPSIGELPTEPIEVTTTCDNLESPQQEPEPVASAPSPNDEEFLKVETEKSEEVKAKENVENLLQLDSLSTVPPLEEKCPSPAPPNENESLKADSLLEINDESGVQLDQSEDNSKAELPSFVSAEQSVAPLSLDVDTTNVDLHLQETLEAAENSIDVSNIQCSLNKSAADTSSINTASFLERSLFEEVKCPISPNLSVNEPTVTSCETSSLLKTEESINISQSSPVREQQPDLSKVTSTPVADKLEVVKSLATEAKSPADDKTSKAKEADKKPATKTKVTSSTTAKKVPPTKSTLAPTTKTTTTKPSPKPAAKPISKTNTTASKVNSTSKTEPALSKVANKSSTTAASKANTTTARVPLSSRTTTTTNKTNGTAAKPATKLSAGTVKKSTEGSSMRSATSTGQSKTTSTTAKSTLASARSATSTAAPKQRPSTLKSAVTKTVDAPKPATARTTTAPRVPLTSRTTASKTSSSLVNKDVKDSAGRTISKPRSTTEKQVKETANKLTAASRAVSKTTSTIQSLAKTTTVTKKSEVTGTRTATSRTTTTSKAPIKKPSETNKTATTKVGKPKLNGVAPVVNEKIIVNNAPKELNSVNTNGDQQFVKDNSPVDNKLITDQLSESATN